MCRELLMVIRLSLLIGFLLFLGVDAFPHGMSEEQKQAIISGGNLQFLNIGAIHMLTGYDHLLFVFGIVFYFRSFFDVIKYITAFTIGHSLTLLTATFVEFTLSYQLIDALIALSVCYIGYENIGGFRSLFKKQLNLLVIIFIFGLIHGLGLSTRLQELPLGDAGILIKVAYFNLGVELGQITALLFMVALLIRWRNTESFLQIRNIVNRGIIFAGFLLFLMQMHGYLHNTYPDEFGFPDDNHFHAHEKMNSKVNFPGKEYRAMPDLDNNFTE